MFGIAYLLGFIFSVPYLFLFFIAWIIASLFRPLLVVSAICIASNPKAAVRKAGLFLTTLRYLVFCNDKRWRQPKEDPASFFPDESAGTGPTEESSTRNGEGQTNDTAKDGKSEVERKTIIFVRHGESTWNDTFNRGDRSMLVFLLKFVPNLIYAVFVESYMFVSGQSEESWFYDAPLSYKGINQACAVRTYLQKASERGGTGRESELVELMLGGDGDNSSEDVSPESGKETTEGGEKTEEGNENVAEEGAATNDSRGPTSQLVSSNLRRAISTMTLGFQDRLDRRLPNDSILIVPQLQEISRNPDALSITPPKGTVAPSWIDREITHCDVERILGEQVDTSWHDGNKPVGTNGLKRLESFCTLAFDKIKKESIIVGGHSLWFRSFFRTYLPRGTEHISKKKKLVNGGCVAFVLLKTETKDGDHFMIDPRSITVLYGGF